MRGTNLKLNVYLGEQVIATLRLEQDQLFWQYSNAWQASGFAISPHLPLHDAFPPINVVRFLRNFLPEGHAFDTLLSHYHLSRSNTFALIKVLGADIPGALIFLEEQETLPKKAVLRMLSQESLKKRLANRLSQDLIFWDHKPRLSVAGVQDKVNILLHNNNEFAFGEGTLCSTHILKFETQQHLHLVLNEYVTMQLAACCGLETAKVDLLRLDEFPALLVQRFDRQRIAPNQVKRRLVIDGCQALNLPPDYKYERNLGSGRDVQHIRDGASFVKIFELAESCKNPVLTKQKIVDWLLFNVLIFNYDAHAKNISFFVSEQGYELTPFYDLVNVKMYSDYSHDMAMALGDEFAGDTVNAYQLTDFAESVNLSRNFVQHRLMLLLDQFLQALDMVLNNLSLTNAEQEYMARYKSMLLKRYQHLRSQVTLITEITL